MTHEHDHGDHADHAGHGHEGGHHHVSYADAVRAFRADKDEAFRLDPNSPIPDAAREGFEGLPYFEVDPTLRIEGLRLEPYAGDEPTSFQIPTTDGQLRPAERAGTFHFDVHGTPSQLTAYVFKGSHSHELFVPFQDATTGSETYGAGRYLDLEPEDDGTYSLDFNLAYHPYCVYDARYSCPLTPPENRLSVRIEAGERL
jgi:uncharacterized protein (DUF1684 family)